MGSLGAAKSLKSASNTIASVKKSYQTLMEAQTELGRNMYIGSESQQKAMRKEWNERNEVLRELKATIDRAEKANDSKTQESETYKANVKAVEALREIENKRWLKELNNPPKNYSSRDRAKALNMIKKALSKQGMK